MCLLFYHCVSCQALWSHSRIGQEAGIMSRSWHRASKAAITSGLFERWKFRMHLRLCRDAVTISLTAYDWAAVVIMAERLRSSARLKQRMRFLKGEFLNRHYRGRHRSARFRNFNTEYSSGDSPATLLPRRTLYRSIADETERSLPSRKPSITAGCT